MRSKIILSWNKYINNNHINVNYSIYILPKDSIVNSMCQLVLIPSNKSIINTNKLEINLEKGNYKVAIIASVINEEFPITNMYDFLYLNVSKRLSIFLIIFISFLCLMILLIILFIIFRKKRKFICFRREENTYSSKIEGNENNCNENINESHNLNEDKIYKVKNEELTDLNENLINSKKLNSNM